MINWYAECEGCCIMARYYQHNFEFGMLRVSIPDKLSFADCNDLEEHFKLIMKQARRRANCCELEQYQLGEV